jgi:hypothetical protein
MTLSQIVRQKYDGFGKKQSQSTREVALSCYYKTDDSTVSVLLLTDTSSSPSSAAPILSYFHLVSKLALVLNFLLFCPLFCSSPFTTMFVVVLVVFKTSLACSFKLFKGSIFFTKACPMLQNHIRLLHLRLTALCLYWVYPLGEE